MGLDFDFTEDTNNIDNLFSLGVEDGFDIALATGIETKEAWRREITSIAKLASSKVVEDIEGVQLEGKNWIVQNMVSQDAVSINATHMGQSVSIRDCRDSKIFINGKVNHIDVSQCVNVWVIFSKAVSSCEIVHCKNSRVICTEHIPTIQVDITDGLTIHLPSTVDTRVVAASSMNINVILSHGTEKAKKYPVRCSMFSEQLVCFVDKGKLWSVGANKLKSGKYIILP